MDIQVLHNSDCAIAPYSQHACTANSPNQEYWYYFIKTHYLGLLYFDDITVIGSLVKPAHPCVPICMLG